MNTGRDTQELAADYGAALQPKAFERSRRGIAVETVLKETLDKLASALAALQILADACDTVGVKYFDTDTMSPEVETMQAATACARSVLSKSL